MPDDREAEGPAVDRESSLDLKSDDSGETAAHRCNAEVTVVISTGTGVIFLAVLVLAVMNYCRGG